MQLLECGIYYLGCLATIHYFKTASVGLLPLILYENVKEYSSLREKTVCDILWKFMAAYATNIENELNV